VGWCGRLCHPGIRSRYSYAIVLRANRDVGRTHSREQSPRRVTGRLIEGMDMPFYLHQWNYKDQYIKKMMLEPEDRADVVRTATAAFGGTLHSFFYCFGRYDG